MRLRSILMTASSAIAIHAVIKHVISVEQPHGWFGAFYSEGYAHDPS